MLLCCSAALLLCRTARERVRNRFSPARLPRIRSAHAVERRSAARENRNMSTSPATAPSTIVASAEHPPAKDHIKTAADHYMPDAAGAA